VIVNTVVIVIEIGDVNVVVIINVIVIVFVVA
jgi:hypothetical protein